MKHPSYNFVNNQSYSVVLLANVLINLLMVCVFWTLMIKGEPPPSSPETRKAFQLGNQKQWLLPHY